MNNELELEIFIGLLLVCFACYAIYALCFTFVQRLEDPLKIMPCPKCKSKQVGVWHSLSTRKYFVECKNCHLCGKSKFFKRRAIKSWNRMPGQIEEA